MNQLVQEGIELNRSYAYKFCSPSRSALQSGRLPVHVNTQNIDITARNPDDPVSGFSGIPRNMTGLATKLKEAGYACHQIGKWDAGMATVDHTPKGRGYDSSFGYFSHDNDYWTEVIPRGSHCVDSAGTNHSPVDLWDTDHGATHAHGTLDNSSGTTGSVRDYEEYKFGQRALDVIAAHDTTSAGRPLFLSYNSHVVHDPLQVPKVYEDAFGFVHDDLVVEGTHQRRTYAAMIKFADDIVGNLTAALKKKGIWENTLLVMQSDNGGPSFSKYPYQR
eukprot:g5800.t1